MKKIPILLLILSLIISVNSYSQSFYGESDVINYSSSRIFSNMDNSVKIQIGYDGIKVNGNSAYFNLEITVLNSTTAIIKGYSVTNPDGTISFRINNTNGCIVQGGDSYCVSYTKQSSPTPTPTGPVTNQPISNQPTTIKYKEIAYALLSYNPSVVGNGEAVYNVLKKYDKEFDQTKLDKELDAYKNERCAKVPKTTTEIKAFQDFMDRNYPNWFNGKNLNKGTGYGVFDENTKKAFGGKCSNYETPY